jgi:hypothetical protein
MLEEGSTGFCATEDAGCNRDAKAAGTLHSAKEASTAAAMNRFLIPSHRVTLRRAGVCDFHHRQA